MSEDTPSQAEGDRDAADEPSESAEGGQAGPPRTTPSQAEGDDDSADDAGEGDSGS